MAMRIATASFKAIGQKPCAWGEESWGTAQNASAFIQEDISSFIQWEIFKRLKQSGGCHHLIFIGI